MTTQGRPDDPSTVSVRDWDTLAEARLAWASASTETFVNAAPWRTFRWYKGQKHYSGTYWSSTERGHVVYESRLELARLLYADFDADVHRIIAQPFLFRTTVEGCLRRHVPDYLLLTSGGPIVVDVKPRAFLEKPEVDFTLGWARRLVEARGWRYEVWSEPPPLELGNVRFLAGFRNSNHFSASLLEKLRRNDLDARTLREVCSTRCGWPEPVVRSAVFHLIWTHQFKVDVSQPLRPTSILRKEVCQ